MEMNLRTTLRAYPQLSQSMLANYVTKDELAAADYVNSSTLSSTLENYVTEVVNPDPSIVYGRREINGIMTWVPIESAKADQPFVYGMNQDDTVNETTIRSLTAVNIEGGTSTYLIEYHPTGTYAGYFWFCYPGRVTNVRAASGFSYDVPVTLQSNKVPYVVNNVTFQMNCYRTEEIVSDPSLVYKFEVTLGD